MLPTLKIGSTGDYVKVAQILTEYADISGEFDEQYKTYVKTWQLNHGLDADGIIGAKTWAKIAAVAPAVSEKSLRKGKYAQAVQLLVGVTPDGIFGRNTKQAVVAFQATAGHTADGIVGQKTWFALITGKAEEQQGKVLNECVYYCQWDSKWKKVMYSSHGDKDQTIGNSGCGPTSMAMILATWIDKAITPVQTCEDAQKHGYRTYDKGTSWNYFPHVYEAYKGFSKYLATTSIATLEAALREGALAVCSMNSNDGGFWTKSGHFVTAVGVDDKYFYANDPNKTSHPRKQEKSKFKSCMKKAFIFWKG